MRKILIVSLCLSLLASCNLWQKEGDFETLYNNYITAQISELDNLSELIGYKRHEAVEGVFKAALQIPVLMSGAFVTDYDIKVNNTDMSAVLENMKLNFVSPINSGSVSAKKVSLTSITGDLYLLMQDFADVGLFPPEAQAIFAKYNNKWLSYTQKDIDASLSGASPDEVMLSNIAKNISKMGLKDIEGYLTEYPIWKSTADLGMSGDLHRFAIDLDTESVVNLVKKATLDITGSGLTNESEADFRASLASFSFSGEMAFNPTDTTVMDLKLGVAQSGVLIGNITFSTSEHQTELRFTSVENDSEVTFSLTNDKDRDDMKLVLVQSGAELARVTGYMVHDGERLGELSLEATAEGVSLTLKHTSKIDGTFEGLLTLPVGTLNWNGKIIGKKLEALSLKGIAPGWSIGMNLTPDDNMLRGPLTVKNEDNELLNADIGLKVDDGIFGLDLVIKNPDGGSPSLHTSFEITHKKSKFDDAILAPSPSEPLKNMIDDLEKITLPTDDAFSEDTSLDNLDAIQAEDSTTGDYGTTSSDIIRKAKIRELSTMIGAYYSDQEVYPTSDVGCISEKYLSASYIFTTEFPRDPVKDHDNGCGANGYFGYAMGTTTEQYPQFLLVANLEDPESGNISDTIVVKKMLSDGVFDQAERDILDKEVGKGKGYQYVLYR